MKEDKEPIIKVEETVSEKETDSEATDFIVGEEVLEPKDGIKNTTRKIITNAAMIYVLSMMFNMFSVFLLFAVEFLPIALNILNGLAIFLLCYGFYRFNQREPNKIMFQSSIIVFVGAITNIAAQLVTLSYIYAYPASISTAFKLPQNILAFRSGETGFPVILLIYIIIILSNALFTFGFYQLKKSVDAFAIQKRNIFKGQLSLPLGFLFLTLRYIIDTAIPVDVLAGLSGASIFIYLVYFLDMGSVIMIVLGFWYLRRAFSTLDKVNPEIFERIEEARRQAAEARQARGTAGRGGLFGGRGLGGGLFGGGIAPPPQVKAEPEPVSDELELVEEVETKDKKMFCVKCGLELEEDSVFCAECGEENPYLKKGK